MKLVGEARASPAATGSRRRRLGDDADADDEDDEDGDEDDEDGEEDDDSGGDVRIMCVLAAITPSRMMPMEASRPAAARARLHPVPRAMGREPPPPPLPPPYPPPMRSGGAIDSDCMPPLRLPLPPRRSRSSSAASPIDV